MIRSLVASAVAAGILGIVFAVTAPACLVNGATRGEIDSRYATVHNAFTALGMSEVGPLHDAHLSEGQETPIDLELGNGCTTILAVGGVTLADLDASLVDPSGARIARGATHTSEATIRACVETAGRYTLHLKAAHGQGPLLVSTWSGAAPGEPGGTTRFEGGIAHGTCEAPIPLSAGDYSGSTARAESRNDSKKCSPSSGAPEVVYRLDLAARERVSIAMETTSSPDSPQRKPFDSVLYVRKSDCADAEEEVACNDDAPPPSGGSHDSQHSRVEPVLDPGTYYVFVDGYNGQSGGYTMHVDIADVPALAELCSQAAPLTPGTSIDGTTDGAFDDAAASCGEGAHGPDTIYSLALERRSRVRIVERSTDFHPVVHVRAQCDDPDSKRGCAEGESEAAFVGILDPGAYAVFADSPSDASGTFTINAETAPELGAGTRGERCADAIPLVKTEPNVTGDTFNARDDVAGTCGGTGAPDVVYRLDVATRTRLAAHFTSEEGSHELILLRGCSGPKAEIACGKTFDSVVPPGSYFIAVDGESPEGFGAFTFQWDAHDTLAQEAACKAPTALREGETVSGNTAAGGATDKFTPSCTANDGSGGSADLLYRIVVPTRRVVHLRLRPTGWSGVLSVRKSCVESTTAAPGEVHCRNVDSGDVEINGMMDAGTYFVVVDGKDGSSAGTFTLEWVRGPTH